MRIMGDLTAIHYSGRGQLMFDDPWICGHPENCLDGLMTPLGHALRFDPFGLFSLGLSVPTKDTSRLPKNPRASVDSHQLSVQFVAKRVHGDHGHQKQSLLSLTEWLMIEWPEREVGSTKYWLSTLTDNTGFKVLVRALEMRWCAGRAGISLLRLQTAPLSYQKPALPEDYQPRGAAGQAAATYAKLHPHNDNTYRDHHSLETATISVSSTKNVAEIHCQKSLATQ
jgi:hypothetical protein